MNVQLHYGGNAWTLHPDTTAAAVRDTITAMIESADRAGADAGALLNLDLADGGVVSVLVGPGIPLAVVEAPLKPTGPFVVR